MSLNTKRREPLLRLVNVTKRYGVVVALQPLSIEIEEGEFFSLLGPSGCGKTTTLRVIAGFETPNEGAVTLSGQDITRTPPNKRETNTVFQSYALFPHMTAAENVAYPLKMQAIGSADIRRRADEAIAQVEMSAFSQRLPHEMSGGQRQRIALARAIVGRPKVLLLDEPLGALDLKLREQMQHVLVHLQREIGITFVYVTHDQGEALSMSDRIAVMSHGRVQQLAPPQEIYYRPANAFVAGFIGKSNILEGITRNGAGAPVLTLGRQSLPLPKVSLEGAAGKAALRFEAVAIGSEAESCDVRFDAVVEDALFLGNVTETTLRVGDATITALIPSARQARLQEGDRLRAGFASENLVMLAE